MFDPRTHLVLAVAYGGLVVFTPQATWQAAEWGLLVTVILIVRRSRAYLGWLAMLIPMALFFGAVTWWSLDLISGLRAALGLLTLTSVFFLFFACTDPEDLGNALVKAGLPYAAAFVMSAALQFVPVISRKARNVMDAQRARGIELRPGWPALRNYPAFLAPLLIQAFQMAESLAEAMECRGFGRSGRSYLKDHRLHARDWCTMAAAAALTAAALRYMHA
jgi:energy-coupling factor transport system permease protein